MTRDDDLAPIVADGTNPQMIRRAFERLNKRVDVLRGTIDSTTASFSITVTGLQVGTLSGVLKASGGTVSVATSGTDYQAAITGLTEETNPAGTSFVGLHRKQSLLTSGQRALLSNRTSLTLSLAIQSPILPTALLRQMHSEMTW